MKYFLEIMFYFFNFFIFDRFFRFMYLLIKFLILNVFQVMGIRFWFNSQPYEKRRK